MFFSKTPEENVSVVPRVVPFLSKKVVNCYAWRLVELPTDKVSGSKIARALKDIRFSVLYDFERKETILYTFGKPKAEIEILLSVIPGLKFELIDRPEIGVVKEKFLAFPFRQTTYLATDQVRGSVQGVPVECVLNDFAEVLNERKCKLLVCFSPCSVTDLVVERQKYEKKVNESGRTQSGSSFDGVWGGQKSVSTSQPNFNNSAEIQFALEFMQMANQCVNTGDGAFRIALYTIGEDFNLVGALVSTRLKYKKNSLLLGKKTVETGFPDGSGEIMSGEYAGAFLSFSPLHAKSRTSLQFAVHNSEQGLVLGKQLLNGRVSSVDSTIPKDKLVLHTLVSGLNGMGKTTIATFLANSLLKDSVPVVILTPDWEWTRAIQGTNAQAVTLGVDEVNLIKCPENVNTQNYAQDLSNHLAMAVDAGPYTQPVERVLLTALTRVYSKSRNPSKEVFFNEIKAVIFEQYGQGRGDSKYSQNIAASLTILEQVLEQPEYSKGKSIAELAKNGGVIYSGEVSQRARPVVYGLFLTQLLNDVTVNMPEQSRDELKLELILEEAHLTYKRGKFGGSQSEKAITESLTNKMPLLRKRGVGMLFITNFSDQLSELLPRYCQNFIVFKQDTHAAFETATQLNIPQHDSVVFSKVQSLLKELPRFEALIKVNSDAVSHVLTVQHELEPLPKSSVQKPYLSPEQKLSVAYAAPTLSGLEKLCLKSIGEGNNTPSLLIKIKGLTKKYKEIAGDLEKKTLILAREVRTKTKPSIEYSLTDKGKHLYLELFSKAPKARDGFGTAGSPLHVQTIADYKAFYEKKGFHLVDGKLAGKTKNREIDLCLFNPDSNEYVLIEVETGSNDLEQEIRNEEKLAEMKKKLLAENNNVKVKAEVVKVGTRPIDFDLNKML